MFKIMLQPNLIYPLVIAFVDNEQRKQNRTQALPALQLLSRVDTPVTASIRLNLRLHQEKSLGAGGQFKVTPAFDPCS